MKNQYLSENTITKGLGTHEKSAFDGMPYYFDFSSNLRNVSTEELSFPPADLNLQGNLIYCSSNVSNASHIPKKNGIDPNKKKVTFLESKLPKEIKKLNMKNLIYLFNQEIENKWRTVGSLQDKDIDIVVSFENEEDSSEFEMIYTFFVMNLNENEIEFVWRDLRKFIDQILEGMKRDYPMYRKKIEIIADFVAIHIDW